MIDVMVDIGTRGAAWLATYLLHSTVLLVAVLLGARILPRLAEVHANRLWRGAALAGVLTASLATLSGVRPILGSVEVPRPVKAVHVVRELRTLVAGAPGEAPRRQVHREERVVRPDFPQPAHLAAIGFALFLAVATMRGLRVFVRHRALAHILRGRVPAESRADAHELVAWLGTLPGLRSVRVTLSRSLPGPVALGRDEICLPVRILDELGAAEQRGILAHEAAHLLRRDPLWLATLGWIDALLFVQPLNSIAVARFKRSAEVLCDDWAVAATGRPIALARSIATVAGWVRATRPAPVPAMSEAGVSFVGRIERLVQYRTPVDRPRTRALALAAAVVVVLTPFAIPTVHVRATLPIAVEHRRFLRLETAREMGAVLEEAPTLTEAGAAR